MRKMFLLFNTMTVVRTDGFFVYDQTYYVNSYKKHLFNHRKSIIYNYEYDTNIRLDLKKVHISVPI